MTTTPASERNDSERMSKLEGAYEQVNERLGEMNGRINEVRTDMDARFSETNGRIDQLRTDMDTRFDVVNTRFDAMSARLNSLFVAIIGVGGAIVAAMVGGTTALILL